MAGEDRDAAAALALTEQLRQAPYKFDFYQALRRFECAYADKPRLGQSQRPVDDPLRLGQEPSLGFAPASLAAFTPGQGGLPGRLNVNFFGLLGPNGPLPLHLTEHARDRLRNIHDHPLAHATRLLLTQANYLDLILTELTNQRTNLRRSDIYRKYYAFHHTIPYCSVSYR